MYKRWERGKLRDDEPESGGGGGGGSVPDETEETEETPESGDTPPSSQPLSEQIDPVEELIRSQKLEIARLSKQNRRLKKRFVSAPAKKDAPPVESRSDTGTRKSAFSAFFGLDESED